MAGQVESKATPPEWIRALMQPAAYPHPVAEMRLIETHISWVLLTGEFAYKIKKPVDLGFLDFSSLEARKFYCEEELRLNCRTAPEVYLAVVPIGERGGRLCFGAEPALEYAVQMRQFPDRDRLDHRLNDGRVSAQDMRQAARMLAGFHARLPPCQELEPAAAGRMARQPALNNLEHLHDSHPGEASRRVLAKVERWTREQAEALMPVFAARAAAGHVRECHGDLHLANLVAIADGVVPFDGIEFSPELRWIDTASDIAFLVMDLMAHERTDLAYVLLNGWLEETGDYDALEVLRFYLVYRCMVRVKVASILVEQLHEGADGEHAFDARRYLALAEALSDAPGRPGLVLMHGVSGTGKTWVSERLLASLPAVRLRSDRERKRLFGVTADEHRPSAPSAGIYSAGASEKTYETLVRHSATGLRAGFHMLVDATFLRRAQRLRFERLADEFGAGWVILDCSAPEATLRARVRQRLEDGADLSDAGLEVLDYQLSNTDELLADERSRAIPVRSDQPVDPERLAQAVRDLASG